MSSGRPIGSLRRLLLHYGTAPARSVPTRRDFPDNAPVELISSASLWLSPAKRRVLSATTSVVTISSLRRPLKGHECEVAASTIAFHPLTESSSGQPPSPFYHPSFSSSIRYPICYQKADNVPVTPPGSRMSMAGVDHLLSDGPPARLPLVYAIKKFTIE
ncbi:hypothetical protein EVAR_86226_1 [Eumeta japonica]|uniref:Uncharacterized protein n=1 Tax=Eumeta variegata TaxID=151549 RepID=A0A4C1UBY0_EUMVA|nr:hypothetical protein EVAR_86226_1 [Eumeta japonica]